MEEEPPSKRTRVTPEELLLLSGPGPAMDSSLEVDKATEALLLSGPSPVPEENASENSDPLLINCSRSTISNTDDHLDFIDPLIPEEPISDIGPMPSLHQSAMEIDETQESPALDEKDAELHPFEDHYGNFSGDLPEDPARKIVESATLQAVKKFRKETAEQMHIPTMKSAAANGFPKNDLKATKEPQTEGVLYVLQESSGNGTHMIPLHKEVVANDRPDLFMVQMTQKSKDRLNEGPPSMKDFYPGDLVYVFSLQRRPDASINDVKGNFDALRDSEQHKFWNVNEFCLVQRNMIKNQLLMIQNAKPRHRYVDCVASGVNQVVRASTTLLKNAGMARQTGAMAWATIFRPPFNVGRLLRGIRPGESKHSVTKQTDCQPVMGPSPPVVTSLERIAPDDEAKIRACPNIFKKMDPSDPVALEVLVTAARFGLSAALALENKDRDHRTYATTIDNTRDTRKGQIMTFSITNPSGPPSLTSWCRNVSFNMELQNGSRISMEVENATEENNAVIVTARPAFGSRNQVPCSKALTGQNIVISQPFENNLHQLRAMPRGKDLQSIDRNYPAILLIHALAGGARIKLVNIPLETIQLGDLILSDEQSRYACLLVSNLIPAVLANSPFGVGKTLMIVAAARLAVQRSRQRNSLQVLTGITNASVVAMVTTYLNQDKENSGRAVRLISEPNRARQTDALQTPIDMSALWPQEFLNFLIKTDREMAPREEIPNIQLVESVAFLLRTRGLLGGVHFQNSKMKKLVKTKQNLSEAPDLFSTFFRLYRPKIVFATTATLIEHFRNGDWSTFVKLVETVQIDEASQTPWFSLLSLAALFPRAKFGLIGDHHQLSPHAHVDMPKLCKDIAIGNLLQRAAERNLVPAVNVTMVYRCPFETTHLVSALAYNSSLQSKRNNEPPHPLANALHLGSNHPIQVLDLKSESLPSGTSQINRDEAQLATLLVKAIVEFEREQNTKSTIGVLCFYKAQSGLVGSMLEDEAVFVNTVDASQGQEFDITLVLTSSSGPFSSSPFLSDVNRFVVATTRAKHLCLVLSNRQGAATAEVWSRFLNLLPSDAINVVQAEEDEMR